MRPFIFFLLTAAIARAAVTPAQIENVRALLREGKVAAAESAAKAVLAANPREADAHAVLGSVLVAHYIGMMTMSPPQRRRKSRPIGFRPERHRVKPGAVPWIKSNHDTAQSIEYLLVGDERNVGAALTAIQNNYLSSRFHTASHSAGGGFCIKLSARARNNWLG